MSSLPNPIEELLMTYSAGPALLRGSVRGLTAEQVRTPAPPGRWSALEVVCHISDFELVYADRMKRVVAEERPTLFGGDPDLFAAKLAYGQRDLEEELAVIDSVRKQVHDHGLLSGKTVGVDSTLIEANAAMKSIVRKESGEDWRADLQRLAAAEVIERKTREELVRFDKPRKKDGKKKASNEEWESKTDADARIRKMKDGSTHLARYFVPKDKAENAVDLDTGVILAAEITPECL